MVNESESTVKPHTIPLEFFSRRTNRTTQLIENINDDKWLDGRNRWYHFDLENPIYLREIEVITSGYSNWNEIEFEVDLLGGAQRGKKIKFTNDNSRVQVGKLVTAFRFRPEAKWLADTKIKKVSVSGLTVDEFHAYEDAIRGFDKKEEELTERESKAQELAEKVAELTSEKSSLDGDIGQSKAQLLQLEQSTTAIQKALDDDISRRKDLGLEITGLREDRRRLNDEIKANVMKLHALTKEVRLFPSEISGFVKEGNRNILWYVGISVPFVAIIFIVVRALFSSAIDLTQLWHKEPNVDIWTVFLTRLPFVVVAITILEVCGYVVGRLVFEIIKINRQRLSLSKLSIIAKDVSTASAHSTDMSDEDLFQKETELKMELLRDHMKEYVSEEFTYKGTAIQSALSAAAEKLAGANKG